jgi:NADH dehydrogenase FAD-containing subunit/uncharacterized membrane protein YphA (DoxX/SURF4 family)
MRRRGNGGLLHFLKGLCAGTTHSGATHILILIFALAVGMDSACAHERWILTPLEILDWNGRPKPEIFTHWSWRNITMISLFLLFLIGWVRLGSTGAKELFPDLQVRLASYGDHVPVILRFCLAWTLISSAFGAEPRNGVEAFTEPTLFACDLQLSLIGPQWAWLRWAELGIGLAVLFGVYVRFCAVLIIALGLLGAWLFGSSILAYAGALIGVCIYLIMQGPGRFYLPLPTPSFLVPLQSWLASLPRQRAQAIMRVLTGLTILYLGVWFKVLQPNLLFGIVETYHLPILSSAPQAFTLLMTLIEVAAGLLIIAGVLLRPLSIVLLAAFIFFAALLPESFTSHILFYGVMLSFLFNAAGHWREPVANDRAAEIVIVGGGFSAISAATQIEKLIGPYTHVHVTLVHDSSNMLFYPLLPEVVSGGMQPGNVVNPIRRVIPQTRVLRGELQYVNSQSRQIGVSRRDGRDMVIPYDELLLAPFLQPNVDLVPGMLAHAWPIDSVGDALHIRKRALELIEEAELAEDAATRARLLTFAVIGSGQRSCATAVELCQMLKTAEVSYPILRHHGWSVCLYEDAKAPFTDFEAAIRPRRNRELAKAGVELCDDDIQAITDSSLTLSSGERRPVGMVINASFRMPSIRIDEKLVAWPPAVSEDMRIEGLARIWAPALSAQGGAGRFITISDLVALGRAAGYNAWANSQNFPTRPLRLKHWLFASYNMGRRSLCSLGGVVLHGSPAWLLSRVSALWALPGFERNLRIVMDWLLDIPFRHDIAVLAPDQTERLRIKHFEVGDEVIRQGEMGDAAYIVEAGKLEVIRDGVRVAELDDGDCFGEIALLSDVPRTATVRCLTPCELTVFVRNDFKSLTAGRGALAEAIRRQASERHERHADPV